MKFLESVIDDKLYAAEPTYSAKLALIFQPDSFADFGGHAEFSEVFRRFTQGDPYRGMDLSRLWCFVLNMKAVLARTEGSLAELGVYFGHSSSVISYYAEQFNRDFFLIDTFSGFSAEQLEDNMDSSKATAFRDTSLEIAKSTVGSYAGNRWIQGLFPACVTDELAKDRFAFVSIDCDLYEPIAQALPFFYGRLNPGGMIFVHDYSSGHWPGAKDAVDQFSAASGAVGVQLADKSGSIVFCKPLHERS